VLLTEPRGAEGSSTRGTPDGISHILMRHYGGHAAPATKLRGRRQLGGKRGPHGLGSDEARPMGQEQVAGFGPNARRAGRHKRGPQSACSSAQPTSAVKPQRPALPRLRFRRGGGGAGSPAPGGVWPLAGAGGDRHTPASRSATPAAKYPENRAAALAACANGGNAAAKPGAG